MSAPRPTTDRSPPPARSRGALLAQVASLGAVALALAVGAAMAARAVSSALPGSLFFSGALLVAVVLMRATLTREVRDRGVALAAAASVGAAPLIAFCCDHALTIPTWDSRPLEGLGPFVLAAIALFLIIAGPLVAFVLAIPLGLWANLETRAFLRFLAALAIAAALGLTVIAAARRARFPEPDTYVPSLPIIAKIADSTCPADRCVQCNPAPGQRPFVLVTPGGTREMGSVEAPCEKLVFRHDPARGFVLVAGDVDRGATLRAWPEVWVYEEATGQARFKHLQDLKDTLAPPLAWVIEAALGVLLAIGALSFGALRSRRGASESEREARATALAAWAFAAAVLFATPLATAWYAGLVPLR